MSQTTRGTGGTLRLAGQPDLQVPVLLRHDAAEAALVRMVLVLSDDDSAELALERSLLTAGLSAPVAEEDVRVAVVARQVAVKVGELTIVLPLADVVDFLLAAYAAAPTGAEHDVVIALTERARALSQA